MSLLVVNLVCRFIIITSDIPAHPEKEITWPYLDNGGFPAIHRHLDLHEVITIKYRTLS